MQLGDRQQQGEGACEGSLTLGVLHHPQVCLTPKVPYVWRVWALHLVLKQGTLSWHALAQSEQAHEAVRYNHAYYAALNNQEIQECENAIYDQNDTE